MGKIPPHELTKHLTINQTLWTIMTGWETTLMDGTSSSVWVVYTYVHIANKSEVSWFTYGFTTNFQVALNLNYIFYYVYFWLGNSFLVKFTIIFFIILYINSLPGQTANDWGPRLPVFRDHSLITQGSRGKGGVAKISTYPYLGRRGAYLFLRNIFHVDMLH